MKDGLQMTELHVVGIGNAIVDILAGADDALLERNALVKGSMTLIDARRAQALRAQMPDPLESSGGSAANTMAGLASLGARVGFIGKVADDETGRSFARDMRAAGVHYATRPLAGGAPSACCLVFVTPDAQRTLNTFLGAAVTLGPADVDESLVASARVTYLEGYLWDPPEAKQAFQRAMDIAHRAGRRVALSLSDSFCVERHRDEFLALVRDGVDLLFANEDEIRALYRVATLEEAAARVGADCELAALTCGAAGALVVRDGQSERVPAAPVDQVLDSTGAGDLFASGFLYGLTHGFDPARAARLGTHTAAAAIRQRGARPGGSLKHCIVEVT